jgi:putative transposase
MREAGLDDLYFYRFRRGISVKVTLISHASVIVESHGVRICKLWNLLAKAPAHLREELAEDYRRMIYAESRVAVEQARVAFTRKWKLCSQAVSLSFAEAGAELFTFTASPISQWKALRTTNALERINEEFRRRTKTQGSLPSEEAVLFLLFGLLRSGQIRLRRLVGWQALANNNSHAEAA